AGNLCELRIGQVGLRFEPGFDLFVFHVFQPAVGILVSFAEIGVLDIYSFCCRILPLRGAGQCARDNWEKVKDRSCHKNLDFKRKDAKTQRRTAKYTKHTKRFETANETLIHADLLTTDEIEGCHEEAQKSTKSRNREIH